MKTIRRSLLLFSLICDCALIGLPPVAIAEDVEPLAGPIAALRVQEREAASPPPAEAATQKVPPLLCDYLITVADDFIVDVYHNGKLVPEAPRPKTPRLIWSDDHAVECEFDATWSSFSEVGNGRNVFHLRE